MAPFARQAAELAQALQMDIPSSSQPGAAYPDRLSKQEVDVLVLIAHGRSNREIGDNLLLSPRTVAPHVTNIFNKIGVRSRTAATAYAIEQGLVAQLPRQTKPRAPAGDERRVSEGTSQALRIILVTDMEGSTALIRRWGDAKALELFRIHNTIIRDCLHKYHGSEVTHTGDGLEASFGSAVDAVECAVAIQRAFAKHNQANPDAPIRVRMGLNAGEPPRRKVDCSARPSTPPSASVAVHIPTRSSPPTSSASLPKGKASSSPTVAVSLSRVFLGPFSCTKCSGKTKARSVAVCSTHR